MICLVALLIFGILGIFSATHRKLAIEALDCVFRKATLRKCKTDLDQRIRSELSGALLKRTPSIAGFVYRHFQIISIFFTVTLILSLGYGVYGGYNFAKYGNCNGPTGDGFCVFDPTGKNRQYAGIKSGYKGPVTFPKIQQDDPIIGPPTAPVEIIEFGCYRCPYTQKAEPIRKKLLEEYKGKIEFTFRTFPVYLTHIFANETSYAGVCAQDFGPEIYWKYHDALFENIEITDNDEILIKLATDLGINKEEFEECYNSRKYHEEIFDDFEAGVAAGVYGTPTFFINNKSIVGPKDISKFRKLIDSELKKVGG
tara:strand:- start:35192 stop:36127 length:936 start_codon:yes stop_codon:yes gene_type:complete